jgi:outer membrane receptor for ferrienterochelin and colicin
LRKIFNILVLLLLFLNFGLSQAGPEDKLISYKCLNTPLNVVLKELSQKSGVNIVFSDSKFKSKKTVTISALNEKLGDVLDVILSEYKLTYEIIENVIVIASERSKEIYKEFTISGTVRDKSNGESLPYAAVFLDDKSQGIYANEKGFYSFKLQRGTYKIIYNYLGYINDTLSLFIKRDSVSNINLSLESTALSEILVREDLSKTSFKYGEDYFSKDKMIKSASLLGEADVLRAIAGNAGVSSGSDGFGGLSIRGGNNDQNLILFDGVPVQNTGHGFGIISIFSHNVVKEARLVKGAMPARYGGRLSSFIDIKTKDGNKTKVSGEVGISTLTSHASIEGPILKDKASFLLSYRRTFADPFIKIASDGINQSSESKGLTKYAFHDFNGKLSFDLDKKNQLSLSFYKGGDDFERDNTFEKKITDVKYLDQRNSKFNWGNDLIALHWNSQIKNNQYSKFIIFQSKWNNQAFKFGRNGTDSLNRVKDIFTTDLRYNNFTVRGLKWDYDFQIKPSNILRFGLGFNQNESTTIFKTKTNLNQLLEFPKVLAPIDLLSMSTPFVSKTEEFNGYFEEEISSGKNLVLNIGVHSSYYKIDSITYPSFQPRLSFSLNGDNSWFNISASYLKQYQQILSENGLGYPSDLWVNSSRYIKPADGYNFSSTLGFAFNKNLALNFGGYYKLMNNIIALGEGQGLTIDDKGDWQKMIPAGKGVSYGGEATFNYTSKLADLELNATYGKTTRLFEDLNNGNEFPYKLDRKFMSNGKLAFKLGNRTEFSLLGSYQGGSKVSIPSGDILEIKLPSGTFIYPIFEGKNNYTFRDYIRLDVAFNFVAKSKIGTHRVFAGVYNLLNRKNPIYLQLERNALELNVYEASEVSVFPILPALSYTLIF